MRWSKWTRERVRIPVTHLIVSLKGKMGITRGIAAALAAAFLVGVPALIAQSQPAARTRWFWMLPTEATTQAPVCGSEPEKTYTLAMSVRLRSLLMARGITVVTTRDSDTTVNPNQRAEIANRANAQACLSLHASESGSGVHVFVSSLAPVEPAPFLPWKTAQSAWVPSSLSLAGTINSALTHAGVSVTLGRIALPGIDSMTCSAVAVEIAPERSSDQPGDQAGKGNLEDFGLPGSCGRCARRGAGRVAARGPGRIKAVIPRHQTILFVFLLIVSITLGAVLWTTLDRAHKRLLESQASTPTQAPQVAPAEQVTLMIANDADNSVTARDLLLPLPQNPEARARAVLGKLLDLYAAPGSPHPVPGGASSIAQVFLMPIAANGASHANTADGLHATITNSSGTGRTIRRQAANWRSST